MATPVRASNGPFAVQVEAGKDYWWCACGLSTHQPFCDGSHRAQGVFTPVKYSATRDTTVWFCGCKSTANAPLCDGSHKRET
ncbi:MAG: CDGSH iron-sulfur domain-containing protein [Caldimonas manganoxidans]|uniref:CDGSH iron-sulfur domain-containing protein n=1 Tax=Caldimonas taiwanensis TaxID=307483 RepID=UPI0009FC8C4C|nr:CDGSH iron-sulfur domain-containing protein [Caldimonas taiwanensis]MCX7660645.1 CDGSH iron-sulfur domain-containing protein [Caldimonas manganoxidans]